MKLLNKIAVYEDDICIRLTIVNCYKKNINGFESSKRKTYSGRRKLGDFTDNGGLGGLMKLWYTFYIGESDGLEV